MSGLSHSPVKVGSIGGTVVVAYNNVKLGLPAGFLAVMVLKLYGLLSAGIASGFLDLDGGAFGGPNCHLVRLLLC